MRPITADDLKFDGTIFELSDLDLSQTAYGQRMVPAGVCRRPAPRWSKVVRIMNK